MVGVLSQVCWPGSTERTTLYALHGEKINSLQSYILENCTCGRICSCEEIVFSNIYDTNSYSRAKLKLALCKVYPIIVNVAPNFMNYKFA